MAIKELRLPEDLSEDDRVVFYRRTLREARAPAQLRTHSIVEVYDVVIEQGRPWIVMEMIGRRASSSSSNARDRSRPTASRTSAAPCWTR